MRSARPLASRLMRRSRRRSRCRWMHCSLRQLLGHSTRRGIDSKRSIQFSWRTHCRLFADRTIVFHQAGVANPLGQGNEELAAFLDEMVLPIRVGRGETFHPKVWVLRFRSQAGEVGLRVLIGSRNLSFDSTWDVLVSMDSGPPGRGTAPGTALADLLRSLPGRSTVKVSEERQKLLDSVASDIARAHFVAPDGCSAAEILWSTRSRPVMPFPSACNRRLVISPFRGVTS